MKTRVALAFLTAISMAAISGCTSVLNVPLTSKNLPTPAPAPTGFVTPAPGDEDAPEPSETAPASEVGVPAVGPVGACQPASREVLDWISSAYSRPSSKVVMVSVGQGNTAGEYWWVVAWTGHFNTAMPRATYKKTYLTNGTSPDKPSGDVWIELGLVDADTNSPVFSTDDWGAVSWTGARLAAGKAAQQKALSCL